MRRSLLIMAIAALLTASMASGHPGEHDAGSVLPPGTYLNHITPWEFVLQPGEELNQTLAFSGAQLDGGWHMLFHVDVDGPGLHLLMANEGAPVLSWRPTAGDGQIQIVTLDAPGWPVLVARNTGEETRHVRLYYDQTCDCTAKFVPGPSGALWFNTHADQGDQVRFRFAMTPLPDWDNLDGGGVPSALDVRILRVAVPAGQSPPETLQTLQTEQATFVPADRCDRGSTYASYCLDVEFAAAATGRQLLWLEASHDGGDWITQVFPAISVEAASKGAPAPAALLAMVGLLVAAYVRRAT